MFSTINGDDEPKKVPLKFGSMLSGVEVKKGRKRKVMMSVDIIVVVRRLDVLGASDLLMFEGIARKLDLKVEK